MHRITMDTKHGLSGKKVCNEDENTAAYPCYERRSQNNEDRTMRV